MEADRGINTSHSSVYTMKRHLLPSSHPITHVGRPYPKPKQIYPQRRNTMYRPRKPPLLDVPPF